MRTCITVVGVAVLALAVVVCPGCKKKAPKPGVPTVEPVEPGEGPEYALSEAPPITDFKEPENKEVFQDVHFDFDRSDVKPADRPILEGIAKYLKDNAGIYLLIEGHCDERGTNEYNLALGERRALNTRAFLAGLGVEQERMVTVTYGEEDPLDPGHTEDAWAKNRRAHFKVATKSTESTQ